MITVVDASVVVDALSGFGGDELRNQLAGRELHAPSHIDVEVLAALRGLIRGRKLTVTRAEDLLADLDALPIFRWEPDDALRRRAFALRNNLTPYDAVYVALAERLQAPFLTRDARIARASGHHADVVVG